MSILIFLGGLSELLLLLGVTALAGSNLFTSTAEWFLLGRQFLFLGTLLFPDSSGSLPGSYLVKAFFFLERLLLPAVSSRSLQTSSSVEKTFLLGFGEGDRWVFHPILLRASWGSSFFFFLGLSLVSSHSSGIILLSEDARATVASPLFSFFKHFFCLPSFLVILTATSSTWPTASLMTESFPGISPVSLKDCCSSPCSWSFSPNVQVGTSEKHQSVGQSCICLPGIRRCSLCS